MGWDKRKEIIQRMDDRHKEDTDKDLEKSTYAKEVAEVVGKGGKIYERKEVKNSRNGLEILTRFRMGNES